MPSGQPDTQAGILASVAEFQEGLGLRSDDAAVREAASKARTERLAALPQKPGIDPAKPNWDNVSEAEFKAGFSHGPATGNPAAEALLRGGIDDVASKIPGVRADWRERYGVDTNGNVSKQDHALAVQTKGLLMADKGFQQKLAAGDADAVRRWGATTLLLALGPRPDPPKA